MRRLALRVKVGLFTFMIGVVATWLFFYLQQPRSETNNSVSPRPPLASSSSSVSVEPTVSPTPNSPIRSIDFRNFTHPLIADLVDPTNSRRTFTLVNGEEHTPDDPISLIYVTYGDVTGDEIEEAMVIFGISIRGTGMPYFSYIYTLRGNRPRLLWGFTTGDRANGGLRQVYAEGGELVVELYGSNSRISREVSTDEITCAWCPCPFTRTRYQWRRGRFHRRVTEENLHNELQYPILVGIRTAN